MKKTTRMMMMNAGKDRRWDREYQADMRGGDYEIEPRFRDDQGREHYDNGRYAPMRSEYMIPYSHHEQYEDYPGRVPPVYHRQGRKGDNRPMNKIGFSVDGEMGRAEEFDTRERREIDYAPTDEMAHRKSERTNGYAMSNETRLTKEMAHDWVDHMENEDGTTGPHWDMEQAKRVMAQKEIDGSPLDFWVALNSMYSDYCKVAKKLGVNTVEFYACMAEAFLNDKDAIGGGGSEKLAAYYEYVVK